MLKGSQIMSLVWTPTIKRTIARMPGHLISFIDAKGILPQKSIQRYQIAPIAQMGFQGNKDSASLPFNSFKPPHNPLRDAVIPRQHQLKQRHINQGRHGKRQRIRLHNNANPHKQPNGAMKPPMPPASSVSYANGATIAIAVY